jgi:antitoxin YefM
MSPPYSLGKVLTIKEKIINRRNIILEKQVYFNTFVPQWYTPKANDMLIVSSREFRQNQKLYFERADKGEQIIVQRGKDKAYALTPINEDDLYFNAEMLKKLKLSIEQAKNGEVKRITSSEEINDLLGL